MKYEPIQISGILGFIKVCHVKDHALNDYVSRAFFCPISLHHSFLFYLLVVHTFIYVFMGSESGKMSHPQDEAYQPLFSGPNDDLTLLPVSC